MGNSIPGLGNSKSSQKMGFGGWVPELYRGSCRRDNGEQWKAMDYNGEQEHVTHVCWSYVIIFYNFPENYISVLSISVQNFVLFVSLL